MTQKRFISSLLITLMLYIGAIVGSGLHLTLYSDMLSFVLVAIVPLIISYFVYSPVEQLRFLKEIFKVSGDGKILNNALNCYSLYRKLTILSGIISVFIGVVGVMSNLQDIETVGKNIAVALLSPIYAALILVIIIEPLRSATQKKLEK